MRKQSDSTGRGEARAMITLYKQKLVKAVCRAEYKVKQRTWQESKYIHNLKLYFSEKSLNIHHFTALDWTLNKLLQDPRYTNFKSSIKYDSALTQVN
jgi:hypothetical protein